MNTCKSKVRIRRYPGHVLPVSDFTGETLDEGSDLLEWGTPAFSVMACKRPLYLQVSHRPQRSQKIDPCMHCSITKNTAPLGRASLASLTSLSRQSLAKPVICTLQHDLALVPQAVLNLGYSVIWSDMDAVWLRDFRKLAPAMLDLVLVDDSEAEEERRSDNTGTGKRPSLLLDPAAAIGAAAITSSSTRPWCWGPAAYARPGSLHLPFAACHAITDVPWNAIPQVCTSNSV